MSNFLITGGTGPLGRQIATYLSEQGHCVVVTTRKHSNFNLPESIKVLSEIDLLDKPSLETLQKTVASCFDGSFSIVNSVGYYDFGQQPFLCQSIEEDDRIMSRNYTTVLHTAKVLLPLMIQRGGGHFITFSCNSVRHNYPWMLPYTAAKAAVEGLTKGLANEFSKQLIYANTLSLATINTKEERSRKPFGDHENWLSTIEIAKYIENIVISNAPYLNGNVINLYQYSDSYYHEGYFERTKREG